MRTGIGARRIPGTLLAAALLTLLAVSAQAQQAAAPCCFNNPRYSGTCQVNPAGDETCQSILAYLNNAAAGGKSYCGSTEIRGGWELVDCAKAKSDAGGGTAPNPACARGGSVEAAETRAAR